MRLLISGATATLKRYLDDPNLGLFFTPRDRNKPELLDLSSWPCGVDNGAFSGFRPDAFLRTLEKLEPYSSRMAYVAVPDVVGDANATIKMFAEWRDTVAAFGMPIGFVAQDGITSARCPWNEFDAFFIGGSTEFKLSADVAALAKEARERGKYVHMGRVNSKRRMLHADKIGCNSVDGSCYSMFPEVKIPPAVRWLAAINENKPFEEY